MITIANGILIFLLTVVKTTSLSIRQFFLVILTVQTEINFCCLSINQCNIVCLFAPIHLNAYISIQLKGAYYLTTKWYVFT